MNRSLRCLAMVPFMALGLAGCDSPESDVENEPTDGVTSVSQLPLYYLSTGLWTTREIPVCWETAGNAVEKAWVRDALRGQRSWSQAANINFTGWGNCGWNNSGIHLRGGSSNVTYGGLGKPSSGARLVELDFTASPQTLYARCIRNNLTREQCIKATALHEFGHAIGYAHEQNRSDTPSTCANQQQGTNGDQTYGSWDGQSIMAYCSFTSDLSPNDRAGTNRLYKRPYADAPRLGDVNGDGRDDLICHDVTNGAKFVSLADSSGRYVGTSWQTSNNFCSHDTARLYKGDFNGDGRKDLLCHDVATGYKWIELATSSGQFPAINWSRAAAWCNTPSARLLVGDFNGDRRDDLLCHDTASGARWIDYADTAGRFNGTDWSTTANFCSHPAAQLLVGDFNGDGRDDLLCHDIGNGYKWIVYADTAGQLGPIGWSRDAKWCFHEGAELLIGDFNGDGRDDLLCHDGKGSSHVELAEAGGRFTAQDQVLSNGWCALNASRILVGDANGDGRDDLICHDVTTGSKAVDYADSTGKFLRTDWSNPGNWCGHTAGELH